MLQASREVSLDMFFKKPTGQSVFPHPRCYPSVGRLQGGPLLVINGVITPLLGVISPQLPILYMYLYMICIVVLIYIQGHIGFPRQDGVQLDVSDQDQRREKAMRLPRKVRRLTGPLKVYPPEV